MSRREWIRFVLETIMIIAVMIILYWFALPYLHGPGPYEPLDLKVYPPGPSTD